MDWGTAGTASEFATGAHVPNFDIRQHYSDADQQDMLVNTVSLGLSLAARFGVAEDGGGGSPEHNVVLMQNHGFTTCGRSIKQAVYRAVYTHANAAVQTKAIMLRAAQNAVAGVGVGVGVGVGGPPDDLIYLDEKQVAGCMVMGEGTQERPWRLWAREVEASPLYRNNA